jgi:hypothetical protein
MVAAAPGRLIPLVIVPLWDVDLARREIVFPENPYRLGLPSTYHKDR